MRARRESRNSSRRPCREIGIDRLPFAIITRYRNDQRLISLDNPIDYRLEHELLATRVALRRALLLRLAAIRDLVRVINSKGCPAYEK